METLDFYNRSGKVERHFEGAGVVARLRDKEAASRSLDQATLDELRVTFEEYGRRSKFGRASVTRSLQVLSALEAPTTAEYHKRVRQLPVVVIPSNVLDAEGRIALATEYWLDGELKARTLSVVGQPGSTIGNIGMDPSPLQMASEEHGGMMSKDRPDVIAQGASTSCQYSDVEGTWAGECATQQEIEDAVITAVSLEADVRVIQESMEGEIADYNQRCKSNPYEDECAITSEATEVESQLTSSSVVALRTEIDSDILTNSILPAGATTHMLHQSSIGGGTIKACYAQGIGYGISLASFGLRVARLGAVLAAPAPLAGAVVKAVAWGMVSAGAVAGTAIALHDCFMSLK